MRRLSHHYLGKYLADHYLLHAKKSHIQAFLIGCTEPDRNPFTYLKGSLRHQWLRGHNFQNASRFIHRISRRLERKSRMNLLDYYTMGKLIHYIADAFTHAHNMDFPSHLRIHMQYEAALQEYFLYYLTLPHQENDLIAGSMKDIFTLYRKEYEIAEHSIYEDARITLSVCRSVVRLLCCR